MLKATLTKEQEDIIKDICDLQIQSLIRISMENSVKRYLDSIGLDIPATEIHNSVSEMLKSFDKLKSKPHTITSLEDVCMSLVKHNLLNNDERYSGKKHNSHKCNLWKKIQVVEAWKNTGALMN